VLNALIRMQFIGVVFDDAYITYRYAHRITRGLGFMYNDGESVLGITTPLLTLTLALGSIAGLPPDKLAPTLNILIEVASVIYKLRASE
jgi:hypothetical protein